jgi:hypothetical protein
MNEEVMNFQLRKFLKTVGVSSQREIERAVRDAVANGTITGEEALQAKMTLLIPAVGLEFEVNGAIELSD